MISLVQAKVVVDKALEHGRALGLHPLTVVVLDAAGVMVVLQREDGSSLLRPDIAVAKAWGTLGMGHGGRELARRAAHAPAFFAALNSMSGGRVAPVPGGVLIRDANALLGAVGVSGDMPLQDEACAIFGVEAAGLTADAGGEA